MKSQKIRNRTLIALTLGLVGAPACGGQDAPEEPSSRVEVAILPLELPGVTDVVYTLSVANDDGETIWSRQASSTEYGDGSGAISYVGPCDGSSNPNIVGVQIDAILAGAQTLVAGADYINPAPAGQPLTREVTCVPDTDVPVTFDLTVMRAASQGFFDFAVSFQDVFCSAKLDCVRSGTSDDLELLFNPNTGKRDMSVVVGLACTAGPGEDTWLHLDDVIIDCGGQQFVVDTAGGPGNLNPPFGPDPNTTDLIFQAATYRGVEQLTQSGTDLNKVYWNVAVGLNRDALTTGGLGACTLTTRATATEGPLDAGVLPVTAFAPYITWDVQLTDPSGARLCESHGMNDHNGVEPVYTDGVNAVGFGASYSYASGEVTDHAPTLAQFNAAATVEASDLFGAPLAVGGFDGDVFDDLAVGAPGEDESAGAISVFGGSVRGPATPGVTWSAGDLLGGTSQAGARFGYAMATGDFDGDGYDDLAVGAPGGAGVTSRVWIIPGSAGGLVPSSAYSRTRAGLSGCGADSDGDDFGAALAAADFNGDGREDLAIGMPSAANLSGGVCLVAGASTGLASAGAGTTPTSGADYNGTALTTGDFDNDGRPDLAIGGPGSISYPGTVQLLFGQTSGALVGGTPVVLSLGAGDTALFGAALTSGDLNGDNRDDLFVGAPGDLMGPSTPGVVYAYFGPVSDTNPDNAVYDTAAYAPTGVWDNLSYFGGALAVSDIDGDSYGDLIIGAPGGDAGRYTVLRGSATGAGPLLTVDAVDAGLYPNGSDRFGAAIVGGDLNGDGLGDFVVGAPGASPASRDAGGQTVYVPGSATASCDAGACGGVCGGCGYDSFVCTNGTCDFDYQYQAASTYPHTIDGLFTDWDQAAPPPRYEWSDVPVIAGQYTDVRLDYDGSALYVMNDWFVNDATPLADGCYNLFTIYTESGAKKWTVKLFATGEPQVFLNGDPVVAADYGIAGAYTFGPSPAHSNDHTLFELKIPAAPGTFGAAFADPPPGASCDALLHEPTTFVGRALAGGGLDVATNTDVPWVFGSTGVSGGTVALSGMGLGTSGAATIGGLNTGVIGWSDETVLLRSGSGGDVVLAPSGGTAVTNTWRLPASGSGSVVNAWGGGSYTIDGAMTGWGIGVPHHEWRDVVPVPLGPAVQLYASYDGSGLRMFYDWLSATPLQVAHIRGWTGGGSGVVGGPYSIGHDGSGIVQWDIIVDHLGGLTVYKDGVAVADPNAEGIYAALGSGGTIYGPDDHGGVELRLPAGATGFGFAITGGGDLSDPGTLITPTHIGTGVLDPVSGLYIRPSDDPALLSISPRSATPGDTITVAGVNLGDGAGGHLYIGGGIDANTTGWTSEQIVFDVPVGADTGYVRVTYDDGRESNGLWLRITCNNGADCASGICLPDNTCAVANCSDSVNNGDETDVDCGGPDCGPCGPNASCGANTDCTSGICIAGSNICSTASCVDGVKNGDETDVDCGGATCDACGNGDDCAVDTDCASLVCTLGTCRVPTCYDGVVNQDETDVDCGGTACGATCANGQLCDVAGDCLGASVTCEGTPNTVCVCVPQCDGKICGADGCGGTCGECQGVQTCQDNQTVCDFVYTTVPATGYPHTVDGQFTDWNPDDPPAYYEWYDIPAAHGQYTNAYFDYTGGKLYILNDWHWNDAGSIDPSCYNLFVAYTGGGAERWQVKVYATGDVQVFLNGALVDLAAVEGGYGYDYSPVTPGFEHTIYELALPASPGRFAVQLHDPGPTGGCATLHREPVSFVGDATSGGGSKLAENPDVSWTAGTNPSKGVEATLVQIYGVAFGNVPGTVDFGAVIGAPVERWTDEEILLRVPAGLTAGTTVDIVVHTADDGDGNIYTTNAMPFQVLGFADEPGAVLNGPSSYPHTVDGEFTDWTGVPGERHEWDDIIPAKGQYTYAYFDFDGDFLYIMNDWIHDDQYETSPACYNQFWAYTGDGLEQWDVRVYGNGNVEVRLNGTLIDPVAAGVEGAAGWGPSPLMGSDHTRYELKIPTLPGGWGLQLHDPSGGNPGSPGFTCEGDLATEPRNFKGVLDPNGGNYVVPSNTATIFALLPPKQAANQDLTIQGAALGASAGSVTFTPAVNATVTAWSADSVTVTVPAGAETGMVKVTTSGGQVSNTLLFKLVCFVDSDCTSDVCLDSDGDGDKECQLPTCTDGKANGDETGVDCGGGTCGLCPAGQGCGSGADCASGVCTGSVCVDPACDDLVQNGDETDVDCGGSCSPCGYGETCGVDADCESGRCDSGACRPTASATATGVPTPISSFQQNVTVTVRVTDIGGDGVQAARVELPDGWLLTTPTTAFLQDGTEVTANLVEGTAGAGPHGGTYYTLSGLVLGDTQWAEIIFTDAQAQEQTGTVRWYTDVDEGLGYARVSPIPTVEVSGAIADGEGSGIITTSPSPVTAGQTDVTVTVSLENTLTDYVATSASEIFNDWTGYGDTHAAWALVNHATYGQVLKTPTNTDRPTYYISNDLLGNGIIETQIGALTSGDDDWIGMIFRWQDPGNFYLLDWKQASAGSDAGRRGLLLRRIYNYDFNGDGAPDVDPATATPAQISAATQAMWNTSSSPYTNNIIGTPNDNRGWADNAMYALRVELDGPNITCTVQYSATVTLQIAVTDYSFASGRYGPYTYSQSETAIKDLKVYRDTITQETVEVEVPAGWPNPVPGGNMTGVHWKSASVQNDVTSLLTAGMVGGGPHGGTLLTADPLQVFPGEKLILTFGPLQAPSIPGTETWYMRTAGVGGQLVDLAVQPTLTIEAP